MRLLSIPVGVLLVLSAARMPAQQAEPTVVSNLEQASKALARGSATLPASGAQPVLVPEDFSLIPLTAGALLDLRVYRVPELSGTLRVDEHGAVQVPLLGQVSVLGKTASALQAELARRFAEEGWLASPQVNLDVLQYAEPSTTVLGEVQMPGRIALQRPSRFPPCWPWWGARRLRPAARSRSSTQCSPDSPLPPSTPVTCATSARQVSRR